MTLREEILNLSEEKYSKKPTRAQYRQKLADLGNQEWKDYDELMYGDGDKKALRKKWEASHEEYEDAKAHDPYNDEHQRALNRMVRENNKKEAQRTRAWNREGSHAAGMPKVKKKYTKQPKMHVTYKMLGR